MATVAPAVEEFSSAQISKTNQKSQVSQIVISGTAVRKEKTKVILVWQERSSVHMGEGDNPHSHLGFE